MNIFSEFILTIAAIYWVISFKKKKKVKVFAGKRFMIVCGFGVCESMQVSTGHRGIYGDENDRRFLVQGSI